VRSILYSCWGWLFFNYGNVTIWNSGSSYVKFRDSECLRIEHDTYRNLTHHSGFPLLNQSRPQRWAFFQMCHDCNILNSIVVTQTNNTRSSLNFDRLSYVDRSSTKYTKKVCKSQPNQTNHISSTLSSTIRRVGRRKKKLDLIMIYDCSHFISCRRI